MQNLTQNDIAKHLDMSSRNLRDVLFKLNLDTETCILDELRIAYIRYLREQAAGRGGSKQEQLTEAKTHEATMSATLKELQIAEKAGKLVPADSVEDMVVAMIISARNELLTLPDKATVAIKAQYGIDIDSSLIEELVYDSLNHLATTPISEPNENSAGRILTSEASEYG